jgi:hypothetical protein
MKEKNKKKKKKINKPGRTSLAQPGRPAYRRRQMERASARESSSTSSSHR